MLASGPRLVWATRAWVLALVSFAFVWIPSRFFPDTPMPAVEGLLVPAALGVSLAVGLGVAAFIEDVRRFHFGWRQVAAVGGAIALVVPDPRVRGRRDSTAAGTCRPPTGTQNLSWMQAEDASGQFRVLWLGDPAVLPVDPVVHGDVGLRRDERRARATRAPRCRRRPAATSARLGDVVDLLRERRSNRVGALLGPMGVRYLAVPQRPDPGLERTDPAPPRAARRRSADQLDLVRLEGPPGLELYENRAWIPGAAVLPRPGRCRGRRRPARTGRSGRRRRATRCATASRCRRARSLWSQSYDGAWSASSNGGDACRTGACSGGRTATRSSARARSRSPTTTSGCAIPRC